MAEVRDGVHKVHKSVLYPLALHQMPFCAWQFKGMWICGDVQSRPFLHIVVALEMEGRGKGRVLQGKVRAAGTGCGRV